MLYVMNKTAICERSRWSVLATAKSEERRLVEGSIYFRLLQAYGSLGDSDWLLASLGRKKCLEAHLITHQDHQEEMQTTFMDASTYCYII